MMRPKDLRQGSGTKTFLDAMHGGKVHLARFVLDALDGRIINSKTESGRTPLMFAVCLQEPGARGKFSRLLLDRGADVNCRDEGGRTAVSLACELGHLDAVKLLVQFNADPDVADAFGNSALMYAAYAGHSQVLEFLIRAFKRLGLGLDRTNHAGHSAIQVAGFFGHSQCVQVLSVPGRRGAGAEEPLSSIGDRRRQPNKLPVQVLERFCKPAPGKSPDQLPGVFQRQLKVGDTNGPWNRFRYQNQPAEHDNLRPTVSHRLERGQTEELRDVVFTSKQLQNCKLRELRGVKTLSHLPEPVQRDRGLKQQDSIPLWGKAKSFNLDLLSSRKQSYQDDLGDMSISASKLKRASLQDERSLIAEIECRENTCAVTNDGDKTVTAPKRLLNGNNQSLRAAPENNTGSQEGEDDDTVQTSSRESQKRGSLPPAGRKLLFHRGEMEPDTIPFRPPGMAGLGTRLLRRFTAPEFMRMVVDGSPGFQQVKGGMSRSETFPFSQTHQKVNSQPSIDSISGVTCEFESSSRVTLD